ncbi:MAG: preprotein translocase subunit SecG [Candidatus Omnitrophica bacterium CG1_02_49_10]|nr:MAG: preprotein translocase subunit SecG [Candidatus Omnitrophica bacterium CG1_02_49_10]
MYILVLIFHVIVAFVLIFVILLQAGKGGGLSESFGGGFAKDVLGTSAETFLTKATSVCAILFLITSLSLTVLSLNRRSSVMEKISLDEKPVSGETADAVDKAEPQGAMESDAPEEDAAE